MRPHEVLLTMLAESFRNAGFDVEVRDASIRVGGVWFSCQELHRVTGVRFLGTLYTVKRGCVSPSIDGAVTAIVARLGRELAARRRREEAARRQAERDQHMAEVRATMDQHTEGASFSVYQFRRVKGSSEAAFAYDGEKFCLLLQDADAAHLLVILDQLRELGYVSM